MPLSKLSKKARFGNREQKLFVNLEEIDFPQFLKKIERLTHAMTLRLKIFGIGKNEINRIKYIKIYIDKFNDLCN